MVTQTKKKPARPPLSRERVFEGAIALADAEGIEALTMRRLAESLGVEAMSLYYHVRNKDAIFDGVVDTLMGQVEETVGGFDVPEAVDDWKRSLRNLILTTRQVMLAHKWAPGVIETRTELSIKVISYFHHILGIMRAGGMSYDLAHHALHALGSRAMGFSQELFEPDEGSVDEVEAEMMETIAAQFPLMVEMLAEISHDGPDETIGWCDDQTEFIFSLDLILDGLETRMAAS